MVLNLVLPQQISLRRSCIFLPTENHGSLTMVNAKKKCIVNVERTWVASIIVSMMLQLL